MIGGTHSQCSNGGTERAGGTKQHPSIRSVGGRMRILQSGGTHKYTSRGEKEREKEKKTESEMSEYVCVVCVELFG